MRFGIASGFVMVVLATRITAADVGECTSGEPFDVATFKARVAFLASEELDGRAPGSSGDIAARTMIAERFACIGLAPAFGPASARTFEQRFVIEGKTTANLVGSIAGTDPDVGSEIILIAAHHDHLGAGHLGANDNASGIVAMLAVAEHAIAHPPKRTLVFAAFGAEETGMNGSYFYAAHAPAALPADRIVQVINLDMVGSHGSRGFVAAMGTFKGLASTPILAKLERDDRYRKLNVGLGGKARGSDFEPFCKQGTPYVFFWTPDKRCYHERCDTADKLDYKRMVDIASLAADLTLAMANTDVDLAAAKAKHGCFGSRR